MPNMPVRGHRAEMEKVTRASASGCVGDDGSHLDLDHPFRPRERRDDEAGGAREHAFSHFPSPDRPRRGNGCR